MGTVSRQMSPDNQQLYVTAAAKRAVKRLADRGGAMRRLDETDVAELAVALLEERVRYIPQLVRYELDGWAVLYENGKLYENVGDSYLSDERLAAWLGVEEHHDELEPFRIKGNIRRDTIPATLEEVGRRAADAAQRKDVAERKRAEAQRLLEEADRLEGNA